MAHDGSRWPSGAQVNRSDTSLHDNSTSEDDDARLEEQPFLVSDSLPHNEKQHPEGQEQRHQSRWSWKTGVLLFILLVLTALALVVVALGIGSPLTEPNPDSNEAASSADSTPTSAKPTQPIPPIDDAAVAKPRIRDSSEYILSAGWDLQAKPTTREYNWSIGNADLNPDGVYRPMILINNQFPGPLVECNEGDTIVVHVKNEAVNATALHFHGLFQNGTNSMDGTVGVTQCPIAPNSTFTYQFKVSGQSGTYWYHAHHSAQASDGLFGPMIIHSKDEKTLQELDYTTDRVIMVQDHYHNTTAELLMHYLRPGGENEEPVPDNALINGRGFRNCSDFPDRRCDNTGISPFQLSLEPEKRHRLRLINVGAFAEFQIQFDEHIFQVTEVDGTDVHPEPFHRLNILPAQRYSLVLETNVTTANAFWMRARMVTHCFTYKNPLLKPELNAVMRYTGSDASSAAVEPASKGWSEAIEVICRDLNTSALYPVIAQEAPPADDYVTLRASFRIGDWRLSRGFFNLSTWHSNATSPSLHRLLDSQPDSVNNTTAVATVNSDLFDPDRELVLQTNGIRVIDFVINSFDDGSHPFHLHGHKFFVLVQGRRGYPPSEEELPAWLDQRGLTKNPLRRDTLTVEGYGWAIIRVVLDNPGLWAFHCHNAWHAEAGMLMQMLVRGDEVDQWHVDQGQRDMCGLDGVMTGMRPDDSIWYGDFGR